MNSSSNQDTCICMHASINTRKSNNDELIFLNTRKSKNDELIFLEILISLGFVPKNPNRKTSQKIYEITKKAFHYSRQAFLLAKPEEIISSRIRGLEIPFAVENINWGLDFPTDKNPTTSSLDEIISTRLSGIARLCAAENDGGACMSIHIRKVEKVDVEKYRKQANRREPLDDWILENNWDKVESNGCLGFLFELGWKSPKDNKLYGLKSEKVESSGLNCSVCIKSLVKNSQAIKMPCSHVFHGFCILKWLQKRPDCPLCRSRLFSSIN